MTVLSIGGSKTCSKVGAHGLACKCIIKVIIKKNAILFLENKIGGGGGQAP